MTIQYWPDLSVLQDKVLTIVVNVSMQIDG